MLREDENFRIFLFSCYRENFFPTSLDSKWNIFSLEFWQIFCMDNTQSVSTGLIKFNLLLKQKKLLLKKRKLAATYTQNCESRNLDGTNSKWILIKEIHFKLTINMFATDFLIDEMNTLNQLQFEVTMSVSADRSVLFVHLLFQTKWFLNCIISTYR